MGVSLGGFLGLVAGLVIAVDPFFKYHEPLPFLNYIIDNQLSQNPGMIKHFALPPLVERCGFMRDKSCL